MMKLLLVTLLIPFLGYADDHRLCQELAPIIQDYEKDLSKRAIQNCKDLKGENLLQGLMLDGQSVPLTDKTFFDKHKCFDLTSLESKIQQLKTELSVHEGISKLKNDIKDSQIKAGNEAQKEAQAAGVSFVEALNIAQSLEVLLNTTHPEGKPFLQILKENSQHPLKDVVAEYCKKLPKNEKTVCNPKVFNPGLEAEKEIQAIISQNPITVEQIQGWKENLSIERASPKNGETTYSFQEMQEELGGAFEAVDKKKVLSKSQLKAIQDLPNFKDVPGFGFLKKLKQTVDKEQVASSSFLLLIGDAQERQKFDVQNKISLAWENHKELYTDLKPEQMANCARAKGSYEEAVFCLGHLKASKGSTEIAALKDQLLLSVESAVNYNKALTEIEAKCTNAFSSIKTIPETCYSSIGERKATLQLEIMQLNRIKDKIGAENKDKMTYRNFALKKWTDKCTSAYSSMDQCSLSGELALSKEAYLTVSDGMDVAVLFTPESDAEEKARELCEDDEKKKRKNFDQKLCDLFKQTPTVIETKNQKITHPDGPIEAPDGLHAESVRRDKYIEAGSTLLKEVLGTYIGSIYNSQAAINPYVYNYAPYNGGTPPLGIADSIMFNARYYGAYGYYMPTPGYQPYTAFGSSSSLASYRPLSFSGTKYFGKY